MPERALLARITDGDTNAFAQLVDRYQRPLFSFLGRMGLTQAQAQDLAQDTFLRAWSQLHRYDPTRAQFSTWLYTIARNLAVDALHAQSRYQRFDGHGSAEAAMEVACEQPNPMQSLALKQKQQQLQSALRQLPMADRSALALVYVHDLSLTDVARIEGDSLSAIKTRLHRAKARLREMLQLPNPKEAHHA